MKILIDDIKLHLLLEQKKGYIGRKITWDSILSATSFLISTLFASYSTVWIIPGLAFKIVFVLLGILFTGKAVFDVRKDKKHNYTYEDLLQDINTLNEITHNHSIIAIRDSFNEYPNRFLVYDDAVWNCKLFINYKDNINNENFIQDHVSRELKVNASKIKVDYVSQLISEKISGRDHCKKVYCHKLFLITITDFPKQLQQDTFSIDGKTYHWMSIVALEKDKDAMAHNTDIIRFVKEHL